MANLHHGVRAGHTWGAHPPPPLWLPRRAAGLGTASARPIRPETTEIKSHIDPEASCASAQCRQEVLEADLLGDEEECLLRDHLLLVQPRTISARDPRRVAQAFRRHRIAAAGSVAASTVRSAGAR